LLVLLACDPIISFRLVILYRVWCMKFKYLKDCQGLMNEEMCRKRIDNYWNFPTYTQQNCGVFFFLPYMLHHIRWEPLITKTPTGVWTYMIESLITKIPTGVCTPRSILQNMTFLANNAQLVTVPMIPQNPMTSS
jgi:hypothetical protein